MAQRLTQRPAQLSKPIASIRPRLASRVPCNDPHYLRSIFAAPPEALRVHRIEQRLYVSRRTLGRYLRLEGLPAPRDWTALARALYAHRTFVRGRSLQRAAYAAGHPDTFTMPAVFLRITGFRPSRLREVDRAGLLDLWILHQRERGEITGPPPATPRTCPICGGLRAS